jgi:hypothetical protein
VVLLVWWLAARRSVAADGGDGSERRLTWYAVTLGVLATWLAIGHYGGLYLLQTRLPIVGQFRAPSRYLNLTAFAGACLAAVAFDRLARQVRAGRRLPWRQLALPGVVAASAAAAALAFHWAYPLADPQVTDRRFVSGALAFVGAVLCLALAVRGRAAGLYGLVLLATLDLLQHSLRNPWWGAPLWTESATLAEFKAATELPPAPYPGRIGFYDCYPMRLLLSGERLVNGYRGGIEPRKQLDYLSLAGLRVAGASWFHEIYTQKTCRVAGLEDWGNPWYRVPDPLPRARLVCRAVYSDDPGRDLAALDLDHAALTERPLALDEQPAGTAQLVEERPGRLRLLTESAGRQLLVVSESHDPNWRVSIDGRPGAVERVNGDFLGCVVGPGQHCVEFTFQPLSVVAGKALSVAGLLACVLLACLPVWRRHSWEGRARLPQALESGTPTPP